MPGARRCLYGIPSSAVLCAGAGGENPSVTWRVVILCGSAYVPYGGARWTQGGEYPAMFWWEWRLRCNLIACKLHMAGQLSRSRSLPPSLSDTGAVPYSLMHTAGARTGRFMRGIYIPSGSIPREYPNLAPPARIHTEPPPCHHTPSKLPVAPAPGAAHSPLAAVQ